MSASLRCEASKWTTRAVLGGHINTFLLCSIGWGRVSHMSRWVLGFLAISLVATALLTGPVRRLSYDDRCLDMGGGTQGARCFFGDLRASAPIGWRYLHAPDARVALGVPNTHDADFQRLYQEADFNGDGRLDEAAVLIDDSGRSYRLFAFLQGSPPEPLTPPLGGEEIGRASCRERV